VETQLNTNLSQLNPNFSNSNKGCEANSIDVRPGTKSKISNSVNYQRPSSCYGWFDLLDDWNVTQTYFKNLHTLTQAITPNLSQHNPNLHPESTSRQYNCFYTNPKNEYMPVHITHMEVMSLPTENVFNMKSLSSYDGVRIY
jgi:hypothetical protein